MGRIIFALVNRNYSIIINLLAFIAGCALAFAVIALDAVILMCLWNIIIPAVFISVPTITFWQAAGLWLICDTLFNHHASTSK